MNIQQKVGPHRSKFYMEEGGETKAEVVYSKGGEGVIVIEHTEVDEALQGHNIGFQLVHKVVDYARSHGLKIRPDCPFAKAVFDKQADFRDVLA